MIFSTLEHILTHISFSFLSIIILIRLTALFFVDEVVKLSHLYERGLLINCFCITGLLVTRWIFSGRFPLSDLYESLIFLSWGFSIIHIIVYLKKKNNLLSIITSSSAVFTQGFSMSGLFTQIHQSSTLVPALQSEWLTMHVTMMILGYAFLLCGSLLSATLLVILFRKSIKIFCLFYQSHFLLHKVFTFDNIEYISERNNLLKIQKNSLFFAKNYYRSQLIQELDYWSYRIISLGFIFLTIGILSGAVWANEAWGSYWNWDPKETWAFITWIIFAIYLHTRTNRNLQEENSAIVASMGFLIIWICYFGVNLFGVGLHSYGSFALTHN
uniref:Cytochrome c biogenesis protein CcsA n=1 Tax=Gentiana zollingeri TaxID=553064 RepID=A0A8K1YJY3_9GENT|nr:cytochrome c heme attachment protein [Gentiana zollingeri]UBR43123.1 cytochrome c heme attachment protein [Gentiana zollingeri]